MFNLTPVVRNIIFLCSAVFLADLLLERMHVMQVNSFLSLYKVSTPYWRPYQLFTYAFAHGNFFHILFNMMILAFVGSMLEMIWGQQRFLMYYMAATIGAALIYLGLEYALNSNDYGAMLGASGAIYALLAAFGVLMPEREIRMMIPPIAVKAKYYVFVIGFFTFLMDKSGTVAHYAHLGGAVIGLIMMKAMKF
jgi:membrane associated rhomboid family serine protease